MSKAFTIFGGTGDLTFRKLLPALYNSPRSRMSVWSRAAATTITQAL